MGLPASETTETGPGQALGSWGEGLCGSRSWREMVSVLTWPRFREDNHSFLSPFLFKHQTLNCTLDRTFPEALCSKCYYPEFKLKQTNKQTTEVKRCEVPVPGLLVNRCKDAKARSLRLLSPGRLVFLHHVLFWLLRQRPGPDTAPDMISF